MIRDTQICPGRRGAVAAHHFTMVPGDSVAVRTAPGTRRPYTSPGGAPARPSCMARVSSGYTLRRRQKVHHIRKPGTVVCCHYRVTAGCVWHTAGRQSRRSVQVCSHRHHHQRRSRMCHVRMATSPGTLQLHQDLTGPVSFMRCAAGRKATWNMTVLSGLEYCGVIRCSNSKEMGEKERGMWGGGWTGSSGKKGELGEQMWS